MVQRSCCPKRLWQQYRFGLKWHIFNKKAEKLARNNIKEKNVCRYLVLLLIVKFHKLKDQAMAFESCPIAKECDVVDLLDSYKQTACQRLPT